LLSQPKVKIGIWIYMSFNVIPVQELPRKEFEVKTNTGWILGSKKNNLCEKSLT